MKKILYIGGLLFSSLLFSQVGINETSPKVNLDIKANSTTTSKDGVLFPQLSLAELTAKGNSLYTTNHKDVLIYINNISGGDNTGTRANIISTGYYYFDGSLWQKITIGDMKNIYEGNNNITSNRTANFDGKTLSIKNVSGNNSVNQFSIDGDTFSVDTRNKKVGIGTSAPNATLDVRTTPTSTTDPGEGFIGIGTTNALASDVGPGAIRYNSSNNGQLQYSNGMAWNTFEGVPDKLNIVAEKNTTLVVPNDQNITITDWHEILDSQNNFDATTGIFTAPRAGNYLITFGVGLEFGDYITNSVVEAKLLSSNLDNNKKTTITQNNNATNIIGSASVSFVINLAANETITPLVYQNSGSSKTLLTSLYGFNNISITEL